MKKLKPWQIVLLVIFYPIGIIYLIYWIVKKMADNAKSSKSPQHIPATQKTTEQILEEARKRNSKITVTQQVYLKKSSNEIKNADSTSRTSTIPKSTEQILEEAKKRSAEAAIARQSYRNNKQEEFANLLNSIPRAAIITDPSAAKQNINVSDFYLDTTQLRKNTNYSRASNFVVVDTETTGLKTGKDKIIQVSAIRFENCSPTEIFATYINPGCHISEEATHINGITDEMVADAPTFESILPALEEFIGASTLVGHNLPFDIKFLRKSGYDSLKVQRMYFDTAELSRKYDDIESHKLTDACEEHNIFFHAHDSSEDALASLTS